jgi:hypothetical protein
MFNHITGEMFNHITGEMFKTGNLRGKTYFIAIDMRETFVGVLNVVAVVAVF